jgi:hypothetical protein
MYQFGCKKTVSAQVMKNNSGSEERQKLKKRELPLTPYPHWIIENPVTIFQDRWFQPLTHPSEENVRRKIVAICPRLNELIAAN